MKRFKVRIFCLILALMLALFATGTVFAWFTVYTRDLDIDGASAGAYFKDGNGTMEDPYSIGNATHMYNFAWLQNTGRIPENTYFDLDPDKDGTVDMTTIDGKHVIIPPIGNDEHPFNGHFDGKGYTISNLIVSTNKDVLYGNPASEDYKFSNAVGLFGMTGNDSEITNFILDNPTVEVANPKESTEGLYKQNTKYNNESGSADLVTGLAIGYVANKASSIGVIGGTLAVRRSNYKTVNSIIGEINPENVDKENLTGGTGGSGSNFGATFAVEDMYDRLIQIEANGGESWRLPGIGEKAQESIVLEKLEKIPFTVTADSTYTGADAAEVVGSNNIGYLLGNQNKVYNKTIKFGDPITKADTDGSYHYSDGTNPAKDNVVPRWLYWFNAENVSSDVYNKNFGLTPLSQDEYDKLPEDLLDLIPSSNGSVEGYNSIRLSQTYQNAGVQIYAGSDSNGQWSPHGEISWMGKTYGEGYAKGDGSSTAKYKLPAVDENGIRYTSDGYHIEDGTDYMYDDEGHYFVSNSVWPFDYSSIDDEGYIIDGDGNRYQDSEGDEIKYSGYTIENDGDVTYLIKPNGSRLLGKTEWNTVILTPKKGTTTNYYNYTKGVALPNCGIWFKPAQAGKIRLVMYTETSGDGFAMLKLTRTSATPEDPFYVDYSQNGKDITYNEDEVIKRTLPKYVLCYFEFEVTQADINKGNIEYWLMEYGSGGAYFVYMDLGSSALGSTTEQADPTKLVTAIDFIYKGVTIATKSDAETLSITEGSFIYAGKLYIETATMLSFGGSTAIVCFYYRNDQGNDIGKFTAGYYAEINGDEDNEIIATYPDKVTIVGNRSDITVDDGYVSNWVP